MSKEDVPPLPEKVPHKRRHVEQALDIHIAQWLAGDSISQSERKRLEVERQRRKTAKPGFVLGILPAEEGPTPEQLSAFRSLLNGTRDATKLMHPGSPRKVYAACKRLGVEMEWRKDVWNFDAAVADVVRSSDGIYALPKTSTPEDEGIWHGIKLARHRTMPVTVVHPDGTIERS